MRTTLIALLATRALSFVPVTPSYSPRAVRVHAGIRSAFEGRADDVPLIVYDPVASLQMPFRLAADDGRRADDAPPLPSPPPPMAAKLAAKPWKFPSAE